MRAFVVMGSSPVRGDHLAITVHQGQRKTQTPRSAQEYTEYKRGAPAQVEIFREPLGEGLLLALGEHRAVEWKFEQL
jgi:hypothetical protein